MNFDTEAMALALVAEFDHKPEVVVYDWSWWSGLDDNIRAQWVSRAGQLIQRYITRLEEMNAAL